jgi:tRNA(fMet)-specific endonuclease VapC
MSLYVLDTDTLSLWLRGQPSVCQRILLHDPIELCTTIVTIEEILSGWYTQIRRARNDEDMARAYAALQQTVEIGSRIPILAFDRAAIQRFNALRKQRRRVGTNDLKIAAMVMEHGAVLVTRNQSDFAKIPALQFEDWS